MYVVGTDFIMLVDIKFPFYLLDECGLNLITFLK